MAAPDAVPGTEPTKFSRYRSVRRIQEQQIQQLKDQQHQVPPMPAFEAQKDAPVSRSMSRYHRQRPVTANANTQKPFPPPVQPPTYAQQHPPLPVAHTEPEHATPPPRMRAGSSPASRYHQRPRNASNTHRPSPTSKPSPEPILLVQKRATEPTQSARDEAKQLMQSEAERQKRMQAKLRAEKRAKEVADQAERERLEKEAAEAEMIRLQREAEEAERLRLEKEKQLVDRGKRLHKAESASRLRARQEEERKARARKYDEAARRAGDLQEDLDESRPKTAQYQSEAPLSQSPPKHGKLGLFRRRKEESPASPENVANTARPRQVSNGHTNLENETIRPGGGGAILGIDAPISAVNAGDRRILIECNKSSILLPVTPTTTIQDLIRSASTCLSEPIDAKTSVLLESFLKVGLQRPLRRYEHVRDVMNSWDDDRQNSLVMVESPTGGVDEDLSASRVPESRPEGMSCYIYYSQKPGKWSKRYVTLRPDGQVVMAKSDTAKDTQNVCHLSDFDIYSPTPRKLAKSVKPPKKMCFAVKSQQKSSMFMDETMFVHFFCTNDKNTAASFYSAVQGWRSWYLINIMGEGQKKAKAPETGTPNGTAAIRTVSLSKDTPKSSTVHSRNISNDSHYQLGTFAPLLDLNQFSKDNPRDDPLTTAFGDTKAMHARKMSTRVKGPPPVSFNAAHDFKEQSSRSRTQSDSSQQSADKTFAPAGLLGRTYSQRQRQLQERDAKNNGPFTEGPNLLNRLNSTPTDTGGLTRRSSTRSNRGHHHRQSSDLHRSASTRVPIGLPKPLIDLTPQYQPPPQFARKGKGYIPESPGAEPLIASATSPEEAIKIPPATDWRARPTTSSAGMPGTGGGGHGTYGIGGHERTRSLRGGGRARTNTHQPTENLAAYALNKNPEAAYAAEVDAFTGKGLLATAGFSQGAATRHGVMDGSKAKGPMVDLNERSKFLPGSLLAGVERVQGPQGPVIERERRREEVVGTGEGI